MVDSTPPLERLFGRLGAPVLVIASLLTLTAQFKESAQTIGWRVIACLIPVACIIWCVSVITARATSAVDESVKRPIYGRTARTLAITLATLSVIPGIYAAYYTLASSTESSQQIDFSVSLAEDSPMIPRNPLWSPPSRKNAAYRISAEGQHIAIEPNCSYLSSLEGGKRLTQDDFEGHYIQFPVLDLKVLNRSTETLFFKEAIINVERSVTDPWPVPVVGRAAPGTLSVAIGNEGWGPLTDCVFAYRIVMQNKCTPDRTVDKTTDQCYDHTIELGSFQHRCIVSVREGLIDAGLDVDGLLALPLRMLRGTGKHWSPHNPRSEYPVDSGTLADLEERVRECLGPFKNECAVVEGELSFCGTLADGQPQKGQFRFTSNLPLVDRTALYMPPAHLDASYTYGASLEPDRQEYVRVLPISQPVKSHEPDRFYVQLGAQRSSLHVLRITLVTTDGQRVTSPSISLRMFIPRSLGYSIFAPGYEIYGPLPPPADSPENGVPYELIYPKPENESPSSKPPLLK